MMLAAAMAACGDAAGDEAEQQSPLTTGTLGTTTVGSSVWTIPAAEKHCNPITVGSSPVRVTRGDDLQSVSLKGLYPAGEGCGYAGGIVSSAIDGLRIAEQICSELA